MKSKLLKYLFCILLMAFLFSGCAEVTNIDQCIINAPCGFWSGLIHGTICPITFLASLFDDSVCIYAINNNGGWYDFGFLLGAGVLFGSST